MASIVVNGDTSGAVTLSAPAVAGTVTVTLPATTGTMLTTASSTGISGSAISSGTVPEAYGGTGTSTGYYGFKNRIINGAMVFDQRNAGASVTPTNNQYLVDRFYATLTQASKFTVQQNAGSVTPPVGFTKYLGVTSSSAYSVLTGDTFAIIQYIEGFNIADLAYGTANAKTVTLSFQVYSSLTGTFGGALVNGAAQNRSYPFTYTISSANTWTQISVTVVGDTTGTWTTDNSAGLGIRFGLGSGATFTGTAGAWAAGNFLSATGATSVVGTNGATFYITGVQLEKGSTATSFDYRPFGTELALCQRYFWKIGGTAAYEQIAMGLVDASTQVSCIVSYPVTMRSAPTLGFNAGNAFQVNDAAVQVATTAVAITQAGLQTAYVYGTTSGLTVGRAARFFIGNSLSAYINFSSEL